MRRIAKILLITMLLLCINNTTYSLDNKEIRFITKRFVEVGQSLSIPVHVLLAIAEYESKYWPWAVNIKGKSFWPSTKGEALTLVQGQKSFDIGIMQVNSWWLQKFNISPDQAIEPELNIYLGAVILNDCKNRFGNIDDMLACYHAGKPGPRGKRYARKVKNIYKEILQTTGG